MNIYAQHVATLASEHRITITHDAADFGNKVLDAYLMATLCGVPFGYSDPKNRRICIRPVVDDVTYAVAMHEMGHILHPDGHLRNRGLEFTYALIQREERNAWLWAANHAVAWTRDMHLLAIEALATYGIEV